ncbi:MAG TPA: hypothetical protein VF469_10915, partial [Kofleriaceae bacterium]
MHDATADVESLHREIARLRSAADHAERKLRVNEVIAEAIDDVLAGETSDDTGVPLLLAGLGRALGCAIASFWAPGAEGLERTSRWI